MSATTFLKQTDEITTCPICLEMISPPIILCSNGHGMCDKCKESLTNCSVCQADFVACQPKMLEQLLEALPKPCRFTESGCKMISCKGEHEMFCMFRMFKCPLFKIQDEDEDTRCTWKGEMHLWFEKHLKGHHLTSFDASGNNAIVVSISEFLNDWTIKTLDFGWKDRIFLVTLQKNDDKQLSCTARYVSVSRPNKNYQVVLTFKEDRHIAIRFPLKAVVWDEEESLIDSVNSVQMPLDAFECLANEGGLTVFINVLETSV